MDFIGKMEGGNKESMDNLRLNLEKMLNDLKTGNNDMEDEEDFDDKDEI